MPDNDVNAPSSGNASAILLLLAIIIIIYGNTFQSAWHLDDYPNILHNPPIKTPITNLTTLIDASRFGEVINRPVARLTLALNWNFGQENVIGYHAVNLAIHFLTALMLYLTIFQLCHTPNLRSKYQSYSHSAALIAAILWAVHPIQIQAVTYIVQRMASMVTLFYISAIFFYLKARLTQAPMAGKAIYFMLCLLCFLLGMGCKENIFTLPLALFLIEFLFIQKPADLKPKAGIMILILIATMGLLFIAAAIYLKQNPLNLLNQSSIREFTPLQRLMTEFRVLIFYLSQIIYPAPHRFSIEHDIELSVSLFSPWTTFPSLIIILLLIGIGIRQSRRRPVLSLAILFYFIGHTVESTFISLELIFEHRNYLSSLFLFFPISLGMLTLIDRYRDKRVVTFGLPLIIGLLITTLGVCTYFRNEVWATPKSLLEDALQKAPQSARIYHQLAWAHYGKNKEYNTALQFYRQALELKVQQKGQRALILNNVGAIHYQFGNFDIALHFLKMALDIQPDLPRTKYLLASASAFSGEQQLAMTELDDLLADYPDYPDALALKGFLYLEQRQAETALTYFQQSLKAGGDNEELMMNIGSALVQLERPAQGIRFFKLGRQRFPENHQFLLHLLEAYLKMGDLHQAGRCADELLAQVSLLEMQHLFHPQIFQHTLPVEKSFLLPLLYDKAHHILETLK